MSLASQLEPYKLRARRHRGRMVAALESGDSDAAAAEFTSAKAAIDEGFAFLERYDVPDLDATDLAGDGEREVAEQLADLWGIQGGLYRSRGDESQNDFSEAVRAYDEGTKYEMSKRFRI